MGFCEYDQPLGYVQARDTEHLKILFYLRTTCHGLCYSEILIYCTCTRIMYVADYEAVVKLSDGFNGADLRNVCTEAGLFAIRAEREYVIQEDFMKAVRKVADNKKLESKLDYKPV